MLRSFGQIPDQRHSHVEITQSFNNCVRNVCIIEWIVHLHGKRVIRNRQTAWRHTGHDHQYLKAVERVDVNPQRVIGTHKRLRIQLPHLNRAAKHPAHKCSNFIGQFNADETWIKLCNVSSEPGAYCCSNTVPQCLDTRKSIKFWLTSFLGVQHCGCLLPCQHLFARRNNLGIHCDGLWRQSCLSGL